MGTSKGYLPPTGHLWSDTKRAVSSMNRNGYNSSSIGKAVSSFSKASGGTRSKGNAVVGASGSRVLNFADLVRSIGLNNALDQVGLTHLIGQDPQAVFEGLVGYFSEGTDSLQQSIADQAMQEYMAEMMGSVRSKDELDDAFAKLESNTFIQDFLIKYVQVSFFTNFAEKINTLCKDIGQALKMQERIKDFIRLEIEGNYRRDDMKNMDWKGQEGREYVERKCEEVWEIFERWSDSE